MIYTIKLVKICAVAFALSTLAYGAPKIESGRPIESATMSQISEGMLNIPVGVFDFDGQKNCFAMLVTGIAKDKNRVWLYSPDGIAADGAPIFEKTDFFSVPVEAGLAEKNKTLSMFSTILKLDNGNIVGFWNVGDNLYRSVYNADTKEFVSIGKPIAIKGFRGIIANPDGSFYVYSRAVTQTRPESEGWLDTWASVKKGVPYQPFDGMGAWRGGERRQYLLVQKLESLSSDKITEPVQATPSKEEGQILNRVVPFRSEDGTVSVFVGTDSGNIIHYKLKDDGTLFRTGLVRDLNGVAIKTPAVVAACSVFVEEGKPNLLVGGECGIHFYKFSKFSQDGVPVFESPLPARRNGGRIYGGTLPVVSGVDWDADGLEDIVVGNSYGEVVWFKNVGKKGAPKFTEPKRMKLDGEPFSEKGGYLNLQGPGEACFGYVCPAVIDWNGDGLLDLVTGDNSSRFGVYFNKGTKKSENFRARKPLYCNGIDVHGAWRQRPGVAKLSNGKTGYVILDDDNNLRLYTKIDERNLEDKGKLKLVDGSIIGSYEVRSGETGRLKFMLVDLDSDGKTDILVGAIASCSMPEPKRGIPRNLNGDARKSGVLWLKNVGNDDAPVFEYPRLMRMKKHKENGEFTSFGWHSCSASTADFGSGEKGILVGSEEGEIYFFRFSDIVWEEYESLERR